MRTGVRYPRFTIQARSETQGRQDGQTEMRSITEVHNRIAPAMPSRLTLIRVRVETSWVLISGNRLWQRVRYYYSIWNREMGEGQNG